MLTEDQIQSMYKVVDRVRSQYTSNRANVTASLPFNKFCSITHEMCAENEDPYDVLEKIQEQLDCNRIIPDERLVLGYDSVNDMVHWHVYEAGDMGYNTVTPLHICPPSLLKYKQ